MRPGWGRQGLWSGLIRKPSRSQERQARGVALLSPTPGLGSWVSRCAPHPALFRLKLLHPAVGRSEGAGAASHRVGPSALCAQRCRCLPLGPLVLHKETPPQRLRNRCPSTPPHRALPRPCSCPPAPSMPSPTSFLLPLPFPKTKERSTPSPALTSPHRAPGLAVFPTRQYHKICPVLHPPPPPPAVSTHLSNNLEGTDLTSHFSFSFPPPPSPLPHFLFFN